MANARKEYTVGCVDCPDGAVQKDKTESQARKCVAEEKARGHRPWEGLQIHDYDKR